MKLAILGCGNMGGAILTGVQKEFDWDIVAYDLYRPSVDKYDVTYSEPSEWATEEPDIVLLAVKPQIMKDAVTAFSTSSKKTLWVSIAAGLTLKTLQEWLPENSKVCRVMPNTPALIGESMSAYTLSDQCEDIDKTKIEQILGAIGKFTSVPEYQMNAVVGVSGSGPAYIYTVIEAMIEGGVVAGLPYATAKECAVQTVLGAAKMVQETGEAPAVLKSQVMSPGGTTAAAVKALEDGGLRAALMNGVTAAAKRSEELA